MDKYAEKIYVLVHRCHEQCLKLMHTRKRPDDTFNDIGISTRQGIILKFLLNQDGMTQKEITQRLQVTSSSCGELISKLEQGKYLERRINKNDKRTYNIYLTKSGRKLGEEYKEKSVIALEEWVTDMTGEEKEQLYILLNKLSDGLEKQIEKDK